VQGSDKKKIEVMAGAPEVISGVLLPTATHPVSKRVIAERAGAAARRVLTRPRLQHQIQVMHRSSAKSAEFGVMRGSWRIASGDAVRLAT